VNSNPVSGVNETAIETILSAPAAAESGRHTDAIKRLLQLKANGMPREDAVNAICELYPPGSGSKRKIKKEEFYTAYDGAPQLKPWRESRRGHDSGGFKIDGETVSLTVYKHDGSTEKVPEQDIKVGIYEFLTKYLDFKDDEFVWFGETAEIEGGENDGQQVFRQHPKGRQVGSLVGDEFSFDAVFSGTGLSHLGSFYGINPTKTGNKTEEDNPDSGRKNTNVSRFLHTLIESDTLSKEEQLAIYRRSNLPIVAAVDSGGDSIHAIVKVDAKNFEEYKARVETIHKFLGGKEAGFDATKDPVRFSRLPNCNRGDKRQRLLDTNIGAASFEEFENNLAFEAALQEIESTEIFDLSDLDAFNRNDDENVRIGPGRWLCRGGSVVVQGYTGIGKSSFTLQMAMSWAVGRDFFGLKPKKPLRTLFIQAENDKGDFAEPFQDIKSNYTMEELKALGSNFVACREATKAGADKFEPYLRAMIRKYQPDIVFCDPLLSYFGDDISKQRAASEFFRNKLQPIQNETGVIIVFVHHLGKPSQGPQRQGPAHYQGLGSSDIINWTRETIMLSEEGDGVVKMELGKRASRAGFKKAYLKHSASGILWERCGAVQNSGDVKSAQENKRRSKLEEFVRKHEIVTLSQMTDFASRFGYGKNSIKTALEAVSQNSVDSENPIYSYQAHVNGQKRTSGVYSTFPEPKDGHVRTKDIDPNFTFAVEGVVQPF